MQHDSEMRQLRALDALEALECLFESIPAGCQLESRHVAALIGLAGDGMRAAMPQPPARFGAND